MVDIGNRKRWIRGIVNDAERGAEIIYRGNLGSRLCNARACGQETSLELAFAMERRKGEVTSRGRWGRKDHAIPHLLVAP